MKMVDLGDFINVTKAEVLQGLERAIKNLWKKVIA